jgi:hypothetical protein
MTILFASRCAFSILLGAWMFMRLLGRRFFPPREPVTMTKAFD